MLGRRLVEEAAGQHRLVVDMELEAVLDRQ